MSFLRSAKFILRLKIIWKYSVYITLVLRFEKKDHQKEKPSIFQLLSRVGHPHKQPVLPKVRALISSTIHESWFKFFRTEFRTVSYSIMATRSKKLFVLDDKMPRQRKNELTYHWLFWLIQRSSILLNK